MVWSWIATMEYLGRPTLHYDTTGLSREYLVYFPLYRVLPPRARPRKRGSRASCTAASKQTDRGIEPVADTRINSGGPLGR